MALSPTTARMSFWLTIRSSSVVELELGARVLRVEDLLADLDVHRVRLPSSRRPGPTARISPSWGFSLAVSGSTMPLLVISSRGVGLMTTRSPSGWSLVFVAVANVFLLGRPRPSVPQKSIVGASGARSCCAGRAPLRCLLGSTPARASGTSRRASGPPGSEPISTLGVRVLAIYRSAAPGVNREALPGRAAPGNVRSYAATRPAPAASASSPRRSPTQRR